MSGPNVNKTTLANGIRLITVPMPQVKSVAVLVLVEVGSRYESDKTNGLAHFYEHVVGKGSKKYPNRKTLALVIDKIGAETNAETDKEHTGYWAKAESRHLGKILDFLSQKICWPLLAPVSIEAEKPVIIEEINMREDDPLTKVLDTLISTVFAGHPLGRFTGGSKKTVLKLKRPDFLNLKENFYTGDNTVVVVSGNLQSLTTNHQLRDVVSRYFGNLPKGKRGKFKPIAKGRKGPKVKVVNKKTDQVHLALGFRGFPRLDYKNRIPQGLLSVILGSGMSSRLFQKVREEKSLAYYVWSSANTMLDTGLFCVMTGVDKKRVDEAIVTIIEELVAVKKIKVPRVELRKAKDYWRGHFVLGLEDPLDQAYWYGFSELFERRLWTPDEIFGLVEKVAPDDIARVARQIFTPQNLSLAVVGEGLKEEKLKSILAF